MKQTSTLILEGGALRGIYTSGVLDALMEQQLYLPNVVGVSAGALNGLSYLSGQPGRSRDINLTYVHDKRYMGPSHLLKSFSFFNFDFVFGELSQTLLPFNYQKFYASSQTLWAVATNCRTGKPMFYSSKEMGEGFFDACRASASMPLLCSMVKVNGDVCLDGGIACSVPLPQELPFEAGKIVLVLTRQKGFRKKSQGAAVETMYRRRYKNHPELIDACLNQATEYNRRMDLIDQLEQEGKIFVIRPQTPVRVSRTERDVHKLRNLYEQGYREAMECMNNLRAFLGLEPLPELEQPQPIGADRLHNPLGMPPAVRKAAQQAVGSPAEPDSKALRQAIAQRYDLLAKAICVEAGRSQLLWKVSRAICPQKVLVVGPGMAQDEALLKQAGYEVETWLPATPQQGLDMAQLEQRLQGVGMVLAANPGWGVQPSREQWLTLAAACHKEGSWLVVDESLLELTHQAQEHSLKQDAIYCPQLLVMDDFAASFGMEGLPIAWCVCGDGDFRSKLGSCGPQQLVSAPAQAAALAAMEQEESYLEQARIVLDCQQTNLAKGLVAAGYEVQLCANGTLLVQAATAQWEQLEQQGLVAGEVCPWDAQGKQWRILAVYTEQQAGRVLALMEQLAQEEQTAGLNA
ncbi:aminotransferase class I/II-fold pyridoxal phosphate-dependent enzyme [uncultured Allofournierella sp.]|uniref:aminotransferase class I/II-fold pyridoxal phosphate-dependent enzyme n=1 Tax=uncultured Allofournierella sp. TaxID=1940258 RepID=UPI0037527D4A